MSTKSEQFSAKVRNLQDYHNKILHNIAPLPTGIDIANTLKYFIHTLRSILKGAPSDPPGIKQPQRRRVNWRIPHYPSLDYLGLYEVMVILIDIVPNVQYGQFAFGQAVLQLFGCILWFLEPETADTIPHTVALTLAVFPPSLVKETIELLATTLLPLCLREVTVLDGETFATMSMSTVILMVLQHCKNKAHHAQILESVMTYKEGVYKDILSTIAFGPSVSRAAAANFLFHYWPSLVPHSIDNRDFAYNRWKPIMCQRSDCLTPVNNAAVMMCLDPSVAGTHSKHPPPLYLCSVCSEFIAREESQPLVSVINPLETVSRLCQNKNCSSSDKTAYHTCFSAGCTRQNGNNPIRYCTSCHMNIHSGSAEADHIVQSFPKEPWNCDKETMIYLVEAIISLLKEAHVEEKDPFMAAMEEPDEIDSADEYSQIPMESDIPVGIDIGEEDSRLLSRFGLWLLIEKCTPNEKTPNEIVGRLLSMLFQWFGFTATLTQESIALESLKKEYVTTWILKLHDTHFSVFVNCLMPLPPEYSKVGGYWDTLCSKITELQEGLKKIFSLTPYNSITYEVWDHIMPAWMEAISSDIEEKDTPQLQEVLSKLFDVDISPLPFSTEKTFHFVACKFKDTPAKQQEKALLWLQILSETDIIIPLNLILSMFNDGMSSMNAIQKAKASKMVPPATAEATATDSKTNTEKTEKNVAKEDTAVIVEVDEGTLSGSKPAHGEQHPPTLMVDPSHLTSDLDEKAKIEQDDEEVLRCYVMMLDLLIMQTDMQALTSHNGLENSRSKDFVNLLSHMLQTPWVSEIKVQQEREVSRKEAEATGKEQESDGKSEYCKPPVIAHKCNNACEPPNTEVPSTPCGLCELWSLWYQLGFQLLEHIAPSVEAKLADVNENTEYHFEKGLDDAANSTKGEMNNSNDVKNKKRMNDRSLSNKKKIVKNKENKGIFVAEARKVELFKSETVRVNMDLKAEKEKAIAKRLQKQQMADAKLGKGLGPDPKKNKESPKKVKDTFKPEELTKATQLLLLLLKEVPKHQDANILLNLMNCIKILCLNGECLRLAAKDNPGFLSFAQKNLLIPSFWKLLKSEISAVGQVLVPLMLHCTSLPNGSDIMWDIVDQEMENENWQTRFQTVERVAVLLQHVEKKMLGNNTVIMGTLAHAFSLLISASEDICPAVSARTILLLETVPLKSLKVLIHCLEFQWDSVLEDRVLILSHMHLLHHYLKGVPVLSWEFFMSRLDTLSLEATVDKEQNKEFPFPIDTSRSNAANHTDIFLNKLHRARLARSQSELSTKPRRLSAYFSKNDDKMRSKSMPTGLSFARIRNISIGKSTYSRPSTVNQKSKFPGVGDHIADSVFEDGYLPTLTEDHFPAGTAHAAAEPPINVDLTHMDKETVHRLITLLMTFMMDEASGGCDISERAMSTVLRHLSALLGYSQKDRDFTVPPSQLRESAVFYAVMARLPRMLDCNVKVGNILLPMVLDLLQYASTPVKPIMDNQPIDHTLYFLEPHCRQAWLTSVLIIMYKYSFDQAENIPKLKALIRITLNLLEAQHHHCKPKRPELPTVEDIWGAETPPPKEKVEFTLPNKLDDVEEASEETGSAASVGPTTPLIDTTTVTFAEMVPSTSAGVTIHAPPPQTSQGFMRADILHQAIEEDSEDAEFSEESVQTLGIKPTSRALVASTIEEVEEEELEEVTESLHSLPIGQMEKVQAEASVVGIQRVVKMDHKPEFLIQQAQTVSATSSGAVKVTPGQIVQGSTAVTTQHVLAISLDRNKVQPKYRSKKQRKYGVSAIIHGQQDEMHPDFGHGTDTQTKGKFARERRLRKVQKLREQLQKSPEKKSSVYSAVRRFHEDKNYMALTRCTDCGAVLEEYDDNTISLAIVVLSTFVHRDPDLAAPLLLEMLQVVGRIASATFYTWQTESSGNPPGHCCTVASQFLRCTLHQLAPNGIFPQLFLSKVEDYTFLKTMANALHDFNDLTTFDAVTYLLEGLNERKTLPPLRILLVLMNLAEYMTHLPLEGVNIWTNLVALFETFFRRLIITLPDNCDMNDTLLIIEILLKSPATKVLPTLLEPFGKIITFTIQKARFKLKHLLEVCSLCNRIFTKEREKTSLTRCVVVELVNALKFKTCLPDINLIQIVQFVMVDAGGKMTDFSIVEGDWDIEYKQQCTGAMEILRQDLNDAIEYIGDLHTLTKVRDNLKGGSQNLNEDTLGSQLKAGVAQIIALEFTKSNQADNNKAIQRSLPWLYHPPSAVQIGPKEFIDCIAHVRLLSWLLLGSLMHTALKLQCNTNGFLCQPVPLDAATHIADHIQVILAGFAEQSKASVLHMSSLFHAFILCQLWTMYCEKMASLNPPGSESHSNAMLSIMDFWGRVTPGVLQLLSHSKVLADMVNLHFLSLMEALQECNSSVLAKLFPLWAPILFSYPSKLTGNMQVRVQNCENWPPPNPTKGEVMSYHSTMLRKWLKRLQFKMGQIEIQSSAATQFYTV